ncbi:unnamed protein product [Adineta steineri]|uniref:RING-type domain-containing protein n=1 Tax=Adineta steineri TaxID=433720 RepID=A0A814KUG2_9BILA|nr:unnamed protein product [Adineta steineri]CAF1502103.1 unnamed protein product [Adineta steineri]CAF3610932.1 unnamed protein product [Adineta steineri]CAF3955849.1 unnamed protein product [Adineta steineri]
MASNRTGSVEELITCSICRKYFDDPRLLPCSHIYCRKCIEQIASDNEDQFECPLHDGTLVTKNNINTLPASQIMLELIQLYDSVQSSKQCTNCDSALAEYALAEVDKDIDSNIKMVKKTMSLLRQMIDDRENTIVQEIIDIETKQKKEIENCKTPLRNQLQFLSLRKATLDMLLITKDHTKLLKAKKEFDDYLKKTNETLQSLQIPTRVIYHSQGLNQLQQLKEEILQHGQYVKYNNPELEKLIKDIGTNQALDLGNKQLICHDMTIVADVLRKTTVRKTIFLRQKRSAGWC